MLLCIFEILKIYIRHPASANWMKDVSQLHIVLCCASAGWDLVDDTDDTGSVRGTDGSDGTGTGGMTEVDCVSGGSTSPSDSAALASSA